ncbi:DUF4326 domain-containing protein [Streptomyces sp. NPDC057877]|uniref:DUF4326 domain-containing protein n=1 Tax=Streptomyces sp. NPDC057877 TaxID=3346269 RepID=UPI0036CDA2FB
MTTHPLRVSLVGQRWFEIGIPEDAVYVGRAYGGVKGHPLRNPHAVGKPCRARCHCKDINCATCRACDGGDIVHTSSAEVVRLYRQHLIRRPDLLAMAVEMLNAGVRLACSCPLNNPCHIDVLIELTAIHPVTPAGEPDSE